MQLHESIETNLFNDLSDQEQEVVAGGAIAFSGATYNGGAYSFFKGDGKAFFYYTAPNGKVYGGSVQAPA